MLRGRLTRAGPEPQRQPGRNKIFRHRERHPHVGGRRPAIQDRLDVRADQVREIFRRRAHRTEQLDFGDLQILEDGSHRLPHGHDFRRLMGYGAMVTVVAPVVVWFIFVVL